MLTLTKYQNWQFITYRNLLHMVLEDGKYNVRASGCLLCDRGLLLSVCRPPSFLFDLTTWKIKGFFLRFLLSHQPWLCSQNIVTSDGASLHHHFRDQNFNICTVLGRDKHPFSCVCDQMTFWFGVLFYFPQMSRSFSGETHCLQQVALGKMGIYTKQKIEHETLPNATHN